LIIIHVYNNNSEQEKKSIFLLWVGTKKETHNKKKRMKREKDLKIRSAMMMISFFSFFSVGVVNEDK
jgi:hypothetical protein